MCSLARLTISYSAGLRILRLVRIGLAKECGDVKCFVFASRFNGLHIGVLNIDIVEQFRDVAVCATYRCSTGMHCNKTFKQQH